VIAVVLVPVVQVASALMVLLTYTALGADLSVTCFTTPRATPLPSYHLQLCAGLKFNYFKDFVLQEVF
jgi:hypothetical protein